MAILISFGSCADAQRQGYPVLRLRRLWRLSIRELEVAFWDQLLTPSLHLGI